VKNSTNPSIDTDSIKATVKKQVQDNIENIENQISRPLPKDFTQIFDLVIETVTPTTIAESIEFIKDLPEFLKNFLQFFEEESEELDQNCKEFLNKMVEDLFFLTNGKGIENRIWNHFPKIWNFFRIVNQMEISKKSTKNLDNEIYQITSLYVTSYELTLHFLIEFAFVIASKKKNYDPHAKTFIDKYSQVTSRGQTISRNDLIEFFKKERYLSPHSCNVLENVKFRNKQAHADAYFDAENKKIFYGKESMEFSEFLDLYIELKRFLCYLILIYLKRPPLLSLIDQVEEIGKKITETTETQVEERMKWTENLDWGKCVYCGSRRLIEEDHILAYIKGGVTVIPACQRCNRSKTHQTWTQWLERIANSDSIRDQRLWERINDYNYRKRNPFAKRVHAVQKRV